MNNDLSSGKLFFRTDVITRRSLCLCSGAPSEVDVEVVSLTKGMRVQSFYLAIVLQSGGSVFVLVDLFVAKDTRHSRPLRRQETYSIENQCCNIEGTHLDDAFSNSRRCG